MSRISFDEVSVRGTRRWKDADGKRHQQTRKFYQTINPFNKNADGSLKTREQIQHEISVQCAAWLKEPQ